MLQLIGYWPCNDEASPLIVEDISGNMYHGERLAYATWDNHNEIITTTGCVWMVPPIVCDRDFVESGGSFGDVGLVDRAPLDSLDTYIHIVEVEPDSSDARNINSYRVTPPEALDRIEDADDGTIFTFKKAFRSHRKYTISNIKELSVRTSPEWIDADFAIGDIDTTWNAADEDLPTYKVETSSPGAGGAQFRFNERILPRGRISGVAVLRIDWEPYGLTVWTNDSGAKTVVLEGIFTESGNAVPTQTLSIFIPEYSRRFVYNGKVIEEKYRAGNTFEDSIQQEIRNSVLKTLK
jgi:hypothetical protein